MRRWLILSRYTAMLAVLGILAGLIALLVHEGVVVVMAVVDTLEQGVIKSHLARSVVAMLAVLFLPEAVAWDGQRNLVQLGAAITLVIGALTFYLIAKKRPDYSA